MMLEEEWSVPGCWYLEVQNLGLVEFEGLGWGWWLCIDRRL
jgi:hypothetical protein